jgi:septal ring factor EnvC (AmiA/AmiB activator)
LPTLEERVTRLEKDMDEQKKLRAAQDLDQSDFGQKLRVQHGLIQAIQKTQSEHTATLAQHGQRLDRLEGKVDRLEGKVDRLEGKVDSIAGGVERIVGMLDTLIERDGER